jgi:hypothetical protein
MILLVIFWLHSEGIELKREKKVINSGKFMSVSAAQRFICEHTSLSALQIHQLWCTRSLHLKK